MKFVLLEGEKNYWFFWHVLGAIPFVLLLIFLSLKLSYAEKRIILAVESLPFPDPIVASAKQGANLGLWYSLSYRLQSQTWDESNGELLHTWREILADPDTVGVICTFSGHQAEKLFRLCLRFQKECLSIRPASPLVPDVNHASDVPEGGSFDREFALMANASTTRQLPRRIGVLYVDDSFGKSLFQRWRQVVYPNLPSQPPIVSIPVSSEVTSLTKAISNLTNSATDQLWIFASAPWNCLMARQAREAGIIGPILLVDGDACRTWSHFLPPDNQIIFPFSTLDPASNAKAFRDSFSNTFRSEPDIFAYQAYRMSQFLLSGEPGTQ